MSVQDAYRFKTGDGLQIFWQRVRPEGRARAVLAFVHGHMEHSAKYLHFGRAEESTRLGPRTGLVLEGGLRTLLRSRPRNE